MDLVRAAINGSGSIGTIGYTKTFLSQKTTDIGVGLYGESLLPEKLHIREFKFEGVE